MFKTLSTLVLATALTACSVLPKSTPVTVYQLPTRMALDEKRPQTTAEPRPSTSVSLRVTRPVASPLLTGQRMLVEAETNQLSYYKGSQWSDAPPLLLRQRLLDALRTQGHKLQLSHEERIVQADYELNSELRAFQSIYHDGQTHVLLTLDVSLVKTATQRLLAQQRFSHMLAVPDKEIPAVVVAFGQISDQVTQAVSAWTVAQLLQTQP